MKTSARNVFTGQISAIQPGAVNSEITLTTAGGDLITAMVTVTSVNTLGLAIGKEAIALIKSSSVLLVTEAGSYTLSARNHLSGTINALKPGAVNTEVTLQLAGGSMLHAIITNESAKELGLKTGSSATGIFKASSVILGVA